MIHACTLAGSRVISRCLACHVEESFLQYFTTSVLVSGIQDGGAPMVGILGNFVGAAIDFGWVCDE